MREEVKLGVTNALFTRVFVCLLLIKKLYVPFSIMVMYKWRDK